MTLGGEDLEAGAGGLVHLLFRLGFGLLVGFAAVCVVGLTAILVIGLAALRVDAVSGTRDV